MTLVNFHRPWKNSPGCLLNLSADWLVFSSVETGQWKSSDWDLWHIVFFFFFLSIINTIGLVSVDTFFFFFLLLSISSWAPRYFWTNCEQGWRVDLFWARSSIFRAPAGILQTAKKEGGLQHWNHVQCSFFFSLDYSTPWSSLCVIHFVFSIPLLIRAIQTGPAMLTSSC